MAAKIHATLSSGPYTLMTYAPCGMRISGPMGSDLGSSTDDLKSVTCEACQRTLHKASQAYIKAKRSKAIDW